MGVKLYCLARDKFHHRTFSSKNNPNFVLVFFCFLGIFSKHLVTCGFDFQALFALIHINL